MTNNTRKKGGRKSLPWSGWGRESPNGAARTRMFRKCGYKCFLGTKSPGEQHPDFPICTKGTCDVNTKGIWAAYIRAKQMANSKKSNKGKSPPEFLSTHPSPDNRIKKINEWTNKIILDYPPI